MASTALARNPLSYTHIVYLQLALLHPHPRPPGPARGCSPPGLADRNRLSVVQLGPHSAPLARSPLRAFSRGLSGNPGDYLFLLPPKLGSHRPHFFLAAAEAEKALVTTERAEPLKDTGINNYGQYCPSQESSELHPHSLPAIGPFAPTSSATGTRPRVLPAGTCRSKPPQCSAVRSSQRS